MSLTDEQELDLQLGESREQIKNLRQKLAACKRRIVHLETSLETIKAACTFGLQPENEEETKQAERFVWSR